VFLNCKGKVGLLNEILGVVIVSPILTTRKKLTSSGCWCWLMVCTFAMLDVANRSSIPPTGYVAFRGGLLW
jgi:hypothetical protein